MVMYRGTPTRTVIAPPASKGSATRGPTMNPTPSNAGDRFIPKPKTAPPTATDRAAASPASPRPFCTRMSPAAASAPTAIRRAPPPRSVPAFNTSPVATPSGNRRSASMMSARRRGTEKNTPRIPPHRAIAAVGRNRKSFQ